MGGFYYDFNGILVILSFNVISIIFLIVNTIGIIMSGVFRYNLKVIGVGEDLFVYSNNYFF